MKQITIPHIVSKAEKKSENIFLNWDRTDFLRSTILKALFMKEKIVTLDFIKIKNFSSSKLLRQPTDWEKVFTRYLYPLQINKKKLKSGQKTLTTISQNRIVKRPMNTWKAAQHHDSSEKCKLNPQWDATTHPLGWLKLKRYEGSAKTWIHSVSSTLLMGVKIGRNILENWK